MVDASETVPLEAVEEKPGLPVLVQAYEVAAGVQVAARTEEPPAVVIVLGVAVRVQFGAVGVTVTVALAVFPLLPVALGPEKPVTV